MIGFEALLRSVIDGALRGWFEMWVVVIATIVGVVSFLALLALVSRWPFGWEVRL